MQWGNQRYVVADRALQYYQRFHQPLGDLLRADILDYANGLQLTERQIQLLDDYLERLNGIELNAAAAITEKVVAYKTQRIKAQTIDELIELQASGQLTDAKWLELCRKGLIVSGSHLHAIDYFESLDDRLGKRAMQESAAKRPSFWIAPLDDIVRPNLGRKQLGLVVAPTNRGKSLLLLWIALAYTMQRCNTLLITLEDAQEEVENRLDAIITGIPFLQMVSESRELRERFEAYKRGADSRLRIVDGTDEKFTVPMIERCLDDLREQGFRTDALVIDYDDYLVLPTPMKDRRQEIDSIYRDLKTLGAQRNLYTWTAAQTQRNTSEMKVLSGDKVADDIGKIRKSTMAISIGKGDLGDESFYLYVAKHKFGRSKVGCSIIPNLETELIYDHEKTRRAVLAMKVQQEAEEEFPAD